MRIAITGGAGFIASNIADAYVERGHQLLVIDDLSSGKRSQVPPTAAFIQADVRSEDAARAIRNFEPEVLSHHAAQIDVRKSVADVVYDADVNLKGLLNVVEAARKSGAKKVILASSGGAIYGEQRTFPASEIHALAPVSPYGVAKASSELYLQAFQAMYGLSWVGLRYANVYGPRQNAHGEAGVIAIFARRLLDGGDCIIHGDGSITRDFVFVGDVVRANVAALDLTWSGAINIGTGVETSIGQAYSEIARALGVSRPVGHGPAKLGDIPRSVLDNSLAARLLGWRPQVSFGEGIARTVDWVRQGASNPTAPAVHTAAR